ncbi:MAG: S41 family peptidase [Bacteroides sp.]|nr:S41 family peptidase [Bacteroides sp.]MCM1378599.1 S41 family peptidase [Bacteroides sp.]MCM1444900.1 S41 family peptidase [Prevotella sp.]
MKQLFFAIAIAATVAASAADAPLWLRNAAISPDGTTIAFTYKGDIYSVPVGGGRATQLTSDPAFDTKPFWSPDGKQIAFNSDRQQGMDVFVMPSTGGTPRRITTNSAKETLLGWSGNDTILFSGNLMPAVNAMQGAFQTQVYKVGVSTPSRPEMLASWPMQAASVDPKGRILYQDRKGYEDVLRKHEHSSGTADVWLYENGRYTQRTHSNVQNQNPIWASGNDFYYLSEESNGTMNVHRRTLGATAATALTKFERHPVRSLSAADNGTLAFSWNGELYTLAPGATEPQKVNVEIIADKYRPEIEKSNSGYSASSVSVSPDGEEVAFIHRGDVYVTSVKYKTTKRITNTPEQERNVDFAPDGRSLVYDSERGGLWQLFTASLTDKNEKHFTYANSIEEKLLYASPDALPAFQPAYSPDGKKVAFLENRTALRTIDADNGKHATTVLDGKYNYSYTDGDVSYEWAPDSRWFLIDYIGIGGWNNTDIALVSADGKEVIDLTESGYSDGGAKWAMGGKALLWSTDRNGYRSHGSWGSQRDVYAMFLDPEAYDRFRMSEEEIALADADKKDDKKDDDNKDEDKEKKEKVKPLEFELPNAKYRTVRLTPGAGSYADYLLNKDGSKFYYLSGGDLWVKDTKKGDTKVLTKGAGYSSLVPDKKGENAYLGGWQIAKINLGSGGKETVEFDAERDYSPAREREYMFDHMHKQVKDKFYDPNLHGVDWEFYGREYRRFLPHIDNNYDFAELLSEILGELNASHTGGRYGGSYAYRQTASLGAFFDPNYDGKGLKVTEVINRGPLATKSASVKPGDVIIAIDGTEIAPGADYYPLLENKIGKRTRLTIKRKGGKTEDITVKPTSQGAVSNLLYRRWVERNQAYVDSLSGGRIGYVHVEGMDSPSFREVFSELLGKYRNRDAVVVDTRWNGGGWLHNDIAVLLSGKEYVRFTPRGQYIGSEPFTQWTKPSAMLVNESNYSDAHGTPFVYKTLGIGKLVGAPVPGTMTAVWWENQVDPTIIFGIPQVTSRSMDGTVLENTQLNPDIVVYNNPAEVINGADRQLEAAVRSLLDELK